MTADFSSGFRKARKRNQAMHKCETPTCPHLLPPSSLRFCPGCRDDRMKATR